MIGTDLTEQRARAGASRFSLGLGLLKKQPILIVDDDDSIRAVVSEVLDLEGYRVATAGNGLEGLRLLERRLPTLVLLDMRMPVMDGWGFARELEARKVEVPVVVMTAADNARKWAEEIGADGYVAKPFDLVDLVAVVERFAA